VTIFSARAAGQTTSDLYTLDPITAASTSIGATGHAFTSLAFDPTTGILYGTTSAGSAANPGTLYTIDPATGSATLVGAMGGTVSDIAFDAAGQMWGFTRRTSNGGLGGATAAFLSINKADGSFSIVANTGGNHQGGGISFNSTGILYALIGLAGNSDFYTINTGTGALTLIHTFSSPLEPIVSSAAFDENDLLWYLIGSAGGSPVDLKTITIDTFTRTTIASPGTDYDALAFSLVAPSFGGTLGYFKDDVWHLTKDVA
jgi:uncharacterized repeat protein (TIGR03803 family)